MGHSQSVPKVDFDQEVYFTNADGKRIVCKYWLPETPTEKPSALVFIAHGVAEICHWYGKVAEPFGKHNIVVFAHDHVGHGKSEGDRVHCNDVTDYTRDIFQHVDMMKEKYGDDVPIFIIGHSMGGTVAIHAAMEKPDVFKGVVLIAGSIQVHPETATPMKVAMAKCMASIKPQLQIGKIDSSWVCRDPAVCKEYDDNPWVWHGGLKAKYAVVFLAYLRKLQKDIALVNFPFFALHGDKDKLSDLSGSVLLYDKARSQDKKLKIYKGGYHQLHSEPDGMGAEVISDMANWITERI